MLKQILSNGGSALHLVDAIAQCSAQDIIIIFSGVIRLWLECVQQQASNQSKYNETVLHSSQMNKRDFCDQRFSPDAALSDDDTFHNREKHHLFEKVSNVDIALYRII